ncbi:hypothetical protein [uncultured Roseobacter sp.]|uniref:hypothetical protein n=1 Tax=uncultured Roseobacter sp. TaxID=114847 RepID=UPI00261F988C|nr:hypothetical protein [uncultured Roseobacter sp.]
MFKLRVLQANYGDSLTLEYDDGGQMRYALIDGGPAGTYKRSLKDEMKRIADAGGALDFVAISHVDGDHISGVLDLFSQLEAEQAAGEPPLIGVRALWLNSFSKAIDQDDGIQSRFMAAMNSAAGAPAMLHSGMALQGIFQGNKLRIKALQLGIDINPGFPENLVMTDSAPEIQLGDLTITIVGPTKANLDALQDEWKEWLDDNEPAITSGDPQALANADKSIPNLSSIMFLAETSGKTVLFTGDGRSDHLLDGLGDAGLLDGNGSVHINVLKVPHHGSDRNATRTFFKKVTADTYVISANGHPDNPDLSTLIWIVESAHEQNRQIKLIFTNETRSVEKLREEYPPAMHGYELEVMPSHFWFHELVLA